MAHASFSRSPSRAAWLWLIPLAALTGALAPVSPLAAIAATAAAGALLLLALGQGATKLFLVGLAVILIGYAFLGRGFAYLGAPPIYVGEIVLGLGSIAFVAASPVRRLGPVQFLIVAFMLWGALRTVPYLGTYGLDALRDAVVWGYASFALFLSLLLRLEHVKRLVRVYERVLPLFILWVPIFAVIRYGFPEVLPFILGTNIQIAVFKSGDLAVHLAGAAAFILAGLYPIRGWREVMHPILWAVWLAGLTVVAAISRGGMLAVAAVATLLLFVRLPRRWGIPVVVGLLLLSTAVLLDAEIDVGARREVSAAQLIDNFQSVLGESDDPALADTRRWREEWWGLIVNYAIDGPYSWDGRGYGINLADEDGFQTPDQTLRAPHSAHLNILARSGLPGLALWLAIQAAFAVTLWRGAQLAARTGRRYWLAILGWIFVYWLAALVNMSFDVYLEGPQGGILFWSLIGCGLAVASLLYEEVTQAPSPLAGGPSRGADRFIRP